MPLLSRPFQQSLTALAFVLVGIIYYLFAPAQVGGSASYVMIDGNSMEPGFHYGDLVVVRSADSYAIGDVVTYKDALLKDKYVIHRIKRIEGWRYVFQGDNNAWEDSYHPVLADLVGKLWLHVPKAGKLIMGLRSPVNFAITSTLLGGALLMMFLEKPSPEQPGGASAEPLMMILYASAALALLGGVMIVVAFSKPLGRTPTSPTYQHRATLSYSASADPAVYGASAIAAGEPVFLSMNCHIDVKSSYMLITALPASINGSQELYAVVSDSDSGWSRTIPLGDATPITGTISTSNAIVDLCDIERMLKSVEEKTNLRGGRYTFTVVEHLTVAGSVGKQAIDDTFSPSLQFMLDRTHLYMRNEPEPAAAGSTGSDPFSKSQPGSVVGAQEPNTLSLLGRSAPVASVRLWGIVLFLVAAACAIAIGLKVYSVVHGDAEAMARFQYGATFIDVDAAQETSLGAIVELTNLNDLARLAAQHNASILVDRRGAERRYHLPIRTIAYRFTAPVCEPVAEPPGPRMPAAITNWLRNLRRS